MLSMIARVCVKRKMNCEAPRFLLVVLFCHEGSRKSEAPHQKTLDGATSVVLHSRARPQNLSVPSLLLTGIPFCRNQQVPSF